MKSTNRTELYYAVQQMIAIMQNAGSKDWCLNPERSKTELEDLLQELPSGKQYKAYNKRINKVVQNAIEGKIYLSAAVKQMKRIEAELA